MEVSHLYNDGVKLRAVRRVRLNDLLCASWEFVFSISRSPLDCDRRWPSAAHYRGDLAD